MNIINRRKFITKSTAGFAGIMLTSVSSQASKDDFTESDFRDEDDKMQQLFTAEVKKLPSEDLYDHHKFLTNSPVHIWRRNKAFFPGDGELAISNQHKIIIQADSSNLIIKAAEDFQNYLKVSHGVDVEIVRVGSFGKIASNLIIVSTKSQLQNTGETLQSSKSYEIKVENNNLVICGFDDKAAMHALFHIEEKMNLREAPFLPKDFQTTRNSLYETRLALSWMGWKEWPDNLLNHLVHDGFDGIFIPYANANGDIETAENSTDFYARILYQMKSHDPQEIESIIQRASEYGIKVYMPFIYQFLGTKESEEGLRKLVADTVQNFPGIAGFVLLTEGFWYKNWAAWRDNNHADLKEWANAWCRAVEIVRVECHKINPAIDILPWEYNIQFKPQNAGLKRYFVKQLPDGVKPLITWENGKGFELDGMHGYLRDYALNEIGPAEVTAAQIEEAHKRGMKVFSKVDTFASWQYGTQPYLPCLNQFYERYSRLEKYKVNSTLETWSSGYKPNFIASLRSWTCWTDAPSRDELFAMYAENIFGTAQKNSVLKAWQHLSNAISLVPDTGPNMGTNNAVGTPLFYKRPSPRAATFAHSWSKETMESDIKEVNPYWPYTVARLVFFPDFTNQKNMAAEYAREATGIEGKDAAEILPVFLKYLLKAIAEMKKGLKLYRSAALQAPASKRSAAIKEVIVAEQMLRMMQSDHAILEFEDLRFGMNGKLKITNLNRMIVIAKEEIIRTELSYLAATKDSRLGFQFEQDYVYTPYSLREKINQLKQTLVALQIDKQKAI